MGFFLLVVTGLLALANARPQYGNGKDNLYITINIHVVMNNAYNQSDFINLEAFKSAFRGNATKFGQQQWRNKHDASQHGNEHAS